MEHVSVTRKAPNDTLSFCTTSHNCMFCQGVARMRRKEGRFKYESELSMGEIKPGMQVVGWIGREHEKLI